MMERLQSRDIEVCDAVTVGKHEGLVVLEPLLHALQTPTCLGVQPGVNQVHFPGEVVSPVDNGLPCRQIDSEIVIDGIKVQKVFFNNFRLIPKRNDELMDAVRGIDVHDVPQNRLTADFHHRLGTEDGFF